MSDIVPFPPPPCRIGEKRDWILSDDPELGGFAILVRTSITKLEQAELRAKVDYLEGDYTQQWFSKPPEDRDIDADSPSVMQRKLLAPYVYGWNAEVYDIERNAWRAVAPPAEQGYRAFDAILPEQISWIIDILLGGYYALGKAESLRKLSATIGITSDEKSSDVDPPPPEASTPERRKRRAS